MQNRQLNSEHIRYAPPQGERKPGFEPRHFKVLLLPDQVEETTQGGIALPEDQLDRLQMAQTEGEVIAVGDRAFEDWKVPPEVGERVTFNQWSGQKIIGDDGFDYRVIHDNDILGVRK